MDWSALLRNRFAGLASRLEALKRSVAASPSDPARGLRRFLPVQRPETGAPVDVWLEAVDPAHQPKVFGHGDWAVRRASENLFDRVFTALDYRRLLGNPFGGAVRLTSPEPGQLYAQWLDPQHGDHTHLFTRSQEGDTRGRLLGMHVREGQPRGTGSRWFASIVQGYRLQGLVWLEASAARNDVTTPPLVGYYFAPRVGCDGVIPEHLRHRLPQRFESVERLSELFSRIGGPRAWRTFGETVEVTFDVRHDSPNVRALEAYLQKKRRRTLG